MGFDEGELKAVIWKDGQVYILDQSLLPGQKQYLVCQKFWQVAEAIRQMRVRGAPLVGVVAGYGFALGLYNARIQSVRSLEKEAERISTVLQSTRPTAANLFNVVEQMNSLLKREVIKLKRKKKISKEDFQKLREKVLEEAKKIEENDMQKNMTLSAHGAYLLGDEARVLTICNTGSLATAGYGTALGIIRRAHEQGKKIHVYACETRPYLQGSRLTCFELSELGIPYTLIVDSSAGYLLQKGMVDLIITGADRIARNGDTANKIGTYTLASLARLHGVPFYVAAPTTTIDENIKDGGSIPVEERGPEEVKYFAGISVAPASATVLNYVFDVTPARLISGIVTEKGVAKYPYTKTLSRWIKELKKERKS